MWEAIRALPCPNFPGIWERPKGSLPVIRVTAVTHRQNPNHADHCGPGAGTYKPGPAFPQKPAFWRLVENGMPGKLLNVYAHEAGGGKYLAVLQIQKILRRRMKDGNGRRPSWPLPRFRS